MSEKIINTENNGVGYSLYHCLVYYGGKTWVCRKNYKNKLNAVEMQPLRNTCAVKFTDRIKKIKVKKRVEVKKSINVKIIFI